MVKAAPKQQTLNAAFKRQGKFPGYDVKMKYRYTEGEGVYGAGVENTLDLWSQGMSYPLDTTLALTALCVVQLFSAHEIWENTSEVKAL